MPYLKISKGALVVQPDLHFYHAQSSFYLEFEMSAPHSRTSDDKVESDFAKVKYIVCKRLILNNLI